MITKFVNEDIEHVVLENEFIKLVFLPAIGGKMIELINKKTVTNFLLEAKKKYKSGSYGAPFEKYDTSGFDECFPTVEQCEIKTSQGKTISFPDHGELWSQPWQYKIENDKIILSSNGINWKYVFAKTVSLDDNRIAIDYLVENLENESLPFIWSAHPLLNVNTEDELYLTDEVQNVFLNWSSNKKLGKFGNQLNWPNLNTKNDFSTVQPMKFGKSVKLFSNRLKEFGWVALHKPKTHESLLISFDTDKVPFIGIWLCYGGWPVNAKRKHLTVALEPATGRPDSLSYAMRTNECKILQPGQTEKWRIELALVKE